MMKLTLEISEISSYSFFDACATGDIERIKDAINTGHNCNGLLLFRNKLYTPLMVACLSKNHDSVKCLMRLGADPNLTQEDGISCLDIIREKGDNELLKIVLPLKLRNSLPRAKTSLSQKNFQQHSSRKQLHTNLDITYIK
jgi:hypothetical protein